MKEPKQALAAAREAAAREPAAREPAGRDTSARDPADDTDADMAGWGEWGQLPSADSARRLGEWAIIEPERGQVYSTRRYGRPITAVKLLLVRLLRQYIGQMSAQQSRFNAQVAAHAVRLEERVAELERTAGEPGEPGEPGDRPDSPPAE